MGIMDFLLKKGDENAYYNKIGYSILNEEALKHETKVSIIVPVYNAIDHLKKTVDSVILQNIGFNNITCILVDDCSDDGSQEVMENYSHLYDNIVSIFLESNTGTPAYPRNLGTHLANSTYILYLDADDWLAPDGIKALYDLLEVTKGNYAVGKSIKVDSKGQSITGMYKSNRVRHNVSPFSIRHLFYHLGPPARMMRLDLLKKHKLRFPEMKFAEDKQFFIDVILAAGDVSSTTKTVYYINRYEENNSLTKHTNIFEKMDANIKVLQNVLRKKLDPEKEKYIVNRLIEFDCITRLFDRNHFVKSKDKQKYYDKFNEAMTIFKKAKRPYRFEDTLIKPINKIYFQLAIGKDYETLEALAKWSKKGGETRRIFENGFPYNVAVLENGEEIKIPVQLEAELEAEEQTREKIELEIQLVGHRNSPIEGISLKNRKNVSQVYQFTEAVEQKGDKNVTVTLTINDLQSLRPGSYEFTLMHDDYERLLVKKPSEAPLLLELDHGKIVKLYRTIKNNIGVKVEMKE